jgi:sulfoxide reductase heme-binding subunit YedZ
MAGAGGRVIAVTSSKAIWYLTRGSGAVSLILLTSVMVLGIVNEVRWAPPGAPRFVVQRVHRNLSLLSVVFVGIHIATAVIDGFAPIRWIDAVLPFRSAYRPLWLGFGAVAFDLMIAIAATSLIRAHLGYRVWRAVHWASYGLWVAAVFHGLGVGSDATQPWMLALLVASLGAVLAAVVWRIAVGWADWTPGRVTMAVGAVSLPVFLGAWFLGGPMQAGWAARAGTPPRLLAHAAPSAAPAKATAARAPIVLPSQATASGTTRLHRLAGGLARVNISLSTQGSPTLRIEVILNGTALAQGVSMTDGSVVLTPPDGDAAYRGSVTGLSGGNITSVLADGHGDKIELSLSLQISSSGQTGGQISIGTISTAGSN